MDRTVSSGTTVNFSAGKTKDPDGDELAFKWWQYEEAGSYKGSVELNETENTKVSFTAPQVSQAETIHFILEVSDNGSPALTSYKRFIVTVLP